MSRDPDPVDETGRVESAPAAATDADTDETPHQLQHEPVGIFVVTDDLGEPGAPFSRRNPFYVGFVGGLGVLLAWFLFQAVTSISSVLLLVVVALFLAAGLNPAVEFLERRGLPRAGALTAVILAALGAVALFVVAIAPVITDQVNALSGNVPDWLDRLQENRRVQEFNDEFGVIEKIKDYAAGGDFVSGLFGGALGFGLKVLSVLFNAFIVVVLTLYFLASLELTKNAFYNLAPASRRERVTLLGDRVIRNVGGYVSGAFIVGLTAGLSSLVFLFAVGLGEYAVALAFVVALLDVIPMIGATIGAVLVTAIAFATDIRTGIICAIFYVVYQQVENYVIYPRVMKRSVDVPGAVTVIAALIGAALLGVVGALLAIPTAAAVLLVVREVVVKRQDQR